MKIVIAIKLVVKVVHAAAEMRTFYKAIKADGIITDEEKHEMIEKAATILEEIVETFKI